MMVLSHASNVTKLYQKHLVICTPLSCVIEQMSKRIIVVVVTSKRKRII